MFCVVCGKEIAIGRTCPHGVTGAPGETTIRGQQVACPKCGRTYTVKKAGAKADCPWCEKRP